MNSNLKTVFILFLMFYFQSAAISKIPKYSVNNAVCNQNYIIYVRQSIAILHNVLNLSDEQICKTIDITAKYDSEIDMLSNNIIDKCKTLEILQKNSAPNIEINLLKYEIKKLNCELNKKLNSEMNDFINILNRKQKQKYRLIVHLQLRDYKRDLNEKKYLKIPYNF